MKARRILPFLGTLFLSFLLLNGCGKTEEFSKTPTTGKSGQEANAPKEGKPRIALIMKSLANEFFITMADGAKAHQKQNADQYDLEVNGIKDESDLQQQVALVNQMIATQVDAIVIAPADSKALVHVCAQAQKAGITVVNIDNKLDEATLKAEGVQIPFVGPDNRAGALAVGEALVKVLQPGDPVAIIEGITTAFNGQKRRLGFEDALKAAGMTIVSTQSGQWETEKANVVASAILSANPQLKALLCANDNMALGAVAAVKAAGRQDQVRIVGFDNIAAIRDLVRSGAVLATADQHGDQLAVFGIEYALQILSGQATPQDKQTPVDLITKETVDAGAAAPKP
jgi:ribose transport system substrate-binding protein